MRQSHFLRAILVLFCLSLSVAGVHAQYRASIQGVVTDPDGAVVPGATVTLNNLETNQSLTATTNESGIYNFNSLPPSKYSLAVEMAGLKKKVLENVGVIAEQANAVNIQLEMGPVTETVTVRGDSTPLIDTETSNGVGTITADQIQKLPSFGRDVFQLLQLAPGAFGDGAQSSGGGTSNLPGTTIGGTGGTDGSFKIENSGQITAHGARNSENNYQIDGVATNSVTWGASVITPNEESVKAVKIVTDNYDAENGRFSGAQVQVISQNGSNQYHGSLYFKGHRPGLNAYTKYNGFGGSNIRDANRFNDWGGSVGGPILHNRLFAFFSYENLDNNAAGKTLDGWFETQQYRALAAAPNAAKFFGFPGVAPVGGTQSDQTCAFIGLVEGTNCHFIAGQGLNLGRPLTAPVGTRDAGFVDSSQPGTGGDGMGGSNNLGTIPTIAFYQGIANPSKDSHLQYNGRLDFNATRNDLIAFTFYYVPNTNVGQNGPARLANVYNSGSTQRAATLLWDHTFAPTLFNEARANVSGWKDQDLAFNPNGPWGLPKINFNNTGSIGVSGYGLGGYNNFDQSTYAGKDVLTKVHGAHTMKMGGEFSRLLSLDGPSWAAIPSYQFNNIWDFLNDAPVRENTQADPQTGVPSALTKDVRATIAGLFFQDNYKVRPNLTVTAGLRWEYFGPISETNGKLATAVLGTGANAFSDIKVRTGGSQFTAQKGNFGPQLGFAWSPRTLVGHEFGSRLVIRGGIGIAFNNVLQSNTLDTRFNPPFVSNQPEFTGTDIVYANSFPANVHSPTGYAPNPKAILRFGSNNLPISGRIQLVALPATEPTTYTYHYTLGGEYDLGHQWVASIGYQGSTTRHQTRQYNLYNVGAVQGIKFNPRVSGVSYYANDGSARFNALLLELKHTFSQSFSLDTQYRLSHSLDSGSNPYQGPFYQYDLATHFGTSDYDVRHAFKVFGVWSPTIFKGSHNWAEKIAGGWSLSGILNAHTGYPWSPRYDNGRLAPGGDPVFRFGSAGAGGSSSSGGSGNSLPAAYRGGLTPDFRGTGAGGTGAAFFTPPTVTPGTLFDCLFPGPVTVQCPLGGNQPFGPLPTAPGVARNSFTGPGYFDVDSTLSKSFGLPSLKVVGEKAKLEIRANFYNLFNKLNLNGTCGWQGLQCDILNTHFGQSGSALGARTIEVQGRFSF